MSVPLPDSVKKLLDAPNFAHIATLMPDGSPQATVVWVKRDGDNIIFNTAEGRVKPSNLRRDPRVAVSIHDREDPYLKASIRGRVIDIRQEDGDAVIDELAHKYWGVDGYPYRQGQIRLTVVIEPIS
ncbi:MAG: PPOX class F420-dependent oxidoreductase, partial [Acidimicrobiia bacterium]